jgi:hypothetical protein
LQAYKSSLLSRSKPIWPAGDTSRIARNARLRRTTADVRAAILGEEVAGITRVQYRRRFQLVLVVEVSGLPGVSGEIV